MTWRAQAARWIAAGAMLAGTGGVHAEFAAVVSPARFEFAVDAGQTQRQAVEITHTGVTPGRYRVYTADWSLSPAGELAFSEALAADSCRPWVAIERRTIAIAPGSRLRYRFEVSPPAGTEAVECRFALMIESAEDFTAAAVPMSGRIGVIVYAQVGPVRPDLRIDAALTTRIQGRTVPALRVTNVGTATGRLVGFLKARDAGHRFIELAPDAVPVLPGMTRVIGLLAVPPLDRPNDPPPRVEAWPLAVQGTLEVGGAPGMRIPIDRSFAGP
jgi:hypothetical protein